jgi:hypothetical protein
MAIYINSKGEGIEVEGMDSFHLLNSYAKKAREVVHIPGVDDPQLHILRDEILKRMDNK